MALRWMRGLALAVLVAGCGTGGDDDDSPGDGFVPPLEGTLDQDFFYVGMVDHAGAGVIEDYHCGEKTYDGHDGTDFGIASFDAMEAGVTVSAVKGGTVLETHDGEPDHNTSWVGQSGFGNYVILSHEDGLTTTYGHMTNGSVAVSPGDVVAAGDALGLVGSSGRSDVPHLHLELQVNGAVVDPYAGPCSTGDTAWEDQGPYDLNFSVFTSGFTDQTITFDLVKEPPALKTTWSSSDTTLWFWALLLNVDAGESSEYAFYRPNGSFLGSVVMTHDEYSAVWWEWIYYPVAGNFDTTGTWTLDILYDGVVRTTTEFEVVSAFQGETEAHDFGDASP